MQNPFIFGRPVTGGHFINRKRELQEYQILLNSRQNLILTSRRQVGKTSLLLKLRDALIKNGCSVIYMDLFLVKGMEEFLEYLLTQTAAASKTRIEKFIRWIKSSVKSIQPTFTVDDNGKISVSIGTQSIKKKQGQVLKELFDLPEKLGEQGRNKKQVYIILDEFQRIYEIGGKELEYKLRAIMQQHKNVSYIFAGSNRTLLYETFNNKNRPFLEWGVQKYLGPLERADFNAYITRIFKKRGIVIHQSILNMIYEICDDVPNFIQMFLFSLWNISKDNSTLLNSHIDKASREVIKNNGHYYENIITNLSTMQIRLLKGIASMGGASITNGEFVNTCRLNNSANAVQCAKGLLRKNLIEREKGVYYIRDPFLKLWMQSIP